MLSFLALYTSLADPRWEVRESAECRLVALIDRSPGVYGPRLAELARGATEPEIAARCRRPLAVYGRWRVVSYVPSTVPVWPICDAVPVPMLYGDARSKLIGMEWYNGGSACAAGCDCGPYWHRYRRGTECMVRHMLMRGASFAECDDLLARMWALERAACGDCGAKWAEAANWTRWEGGYPMPKGQP